jgi:hypothetical protein
MADKRVVGAVSVTDDHVICPCGQVIDLEPGPDIKGRKMVYLPQLVGIDCPKCGAEVRLDRFLKDFTFREN